ncbi:unnamed protein product, partial [Urochloa humidicola]
LIASSRTGAPLLQQLPPPSSPPLPSRPLSASAMAQPTFLSSLRSRLRTAPPPTPTPHHRLQPSRGYHVELGAREKALLEEDVALKRFKSYKNSVKRISKIGNVLTLAVVFACTYEVTALATHATWGKA